MDPVQTHTAMSDEPTFSIVLPTKDRPELASRAVKSALAQTRGDFEVVVADNGENPLRPDSAWMDDPRVRIHRTGGLIMCDNWQAAFQQARGKYVCLIEDKMALTPESLQMAYDAIEHDHLDVLIYSIGTNNSATRIEDKPIRIYPIDREELFDAVAQCCLDHYSKIGPRTLNCVFRRSYAEEVSRRSGRLFRPMSPDYSCGAQLLAGPGKLAYTPGHLAMFLPGPSLGNAYASGGEGAQLAEREFGGSIQNLVADLPSQSLLFGNTLLGELIGFLVAGGVPRERIEPHVLPYWLMLISEMLICVYNGADRREDVVNCLAEIRAKPLAFRILLTLHLCKRFVQGWPNRKLKMRANFPRALLAVQMLWRGARALS